MGVSPKKKPNSPSQTTTFLNSQNKQEHDNNKVIVISTSLKEIKIKPQSDNHHHHHLHHHNRDHDDRIVDVDEDDDGFKTPTGAEHRIPDESQRECPPAPRKSMPEPLKRRRLFCRNDDDDDDDDDDVVDRKTMRLSDEEIELLFPPRSILVEQDSDIHWAGNIKKVKKTNNLQTTKPPIVSFR